MKLNKIRIRKKIISFNLTSFFFLILSCTSLTFAWFAYQSVIKTNLEIDVAAWNIEVTGLAPTKNEIELHLNNFYPGVDKYIKTIQIYNKGDIDAIFDYKINYLRILDEEFDVTNQEELYDKLSHNYPFSFNIRKDASYVGTQESINLNIVMDWPLDSGNDALDSEWGKKAYDFNALENHKKEEDENYKIRSVIEVVLELNSMQYIEEENPIMTDNRFLIGNSYGFKLDTLENCILGSEDCYKFYVIDENNLSTDETVNMILEPNIDLGTSNFYNLANHQTDKLKIPTAEQILKAVSTDIIDTNVISNKNISNRLLGNVSYNNRAITKLTEISNNNNIINFNINIFEYLNSNICYWTSTSYNNTKGYAIKNIDNSTISMYGEDMNTTCKIVPVIKVNKSDIIY